MKILYILQSTQIHGGAHVSFMSMLTFLLQKGIEPIIVVPDKKGLYTVFKELNIKVISIPYINGRYPHCNNIKQLCAFLPRLFLMIILNSLAVIRLIKYVKQNRIDIIHSNTTVISIGLQIANRANILHIWHVREYGDKDFNIKYFPSTNIFHKKLRNQSYSICITKGIQEYHNLVSNPKSVVIYNPIDFPVNNIDIDSKQPYFLYVGAVSYNKGIEDVINAFGMFVKRNPELNFTLKIVGRCPIKYLTYLKEIVGNWGVQDKVSFVGVSDNVGEYFKDAYAYIMASHSEGFGRVTAEAMISGALVIGKDVAGTKEQFDLGLSETGEEIGLRYNTVEELSETMSHVAKTGLDGYSAMIHRGQQVANKLYSSHYHAENVYKFYSFILSNS